MTRRRSRSSVPRARLLYSSACHDVRLLRSIPFLCCLLCTGFCSCRHRTHFFIYLTYGLTCPVLSCPVCVRVCNCIPVYNKSESRRPRRLYRWMHRRRIVRWSTMLARSMYSTTLLRLFLYKINKSLAVKMTLGYLLCLEGRRRRRRRRRRRLPIRLLS